ncbi:MAG: hypothetical protein NWE94_05180 [Candidatus Bathyarchaeota archaeon]|nr:hypothetical protein [Candidatus Bathyarchaeota archaeon]
MIYVHEVDLADIMPQLPEISKIQMERDFSKNTYDDLFLCALGFEDRCPWIPRMIAEKNEYKSDEAIYFEYSTNPEDNEINRTELLLALGKFATLSLPMQCDIDDFTTIFRQKIMTVCKKCGCPKITFDISVCSSRLLLQILKILFEFDVELRIVYSEAAIYHPTPEEAKKGNLNNNEEVLTKGVSNVFPSSEHPGYNLDSLPEAIVAFATFNPRRTNAVIAYIDENLLGKSSERLNWIIGIPHAQEDQWRIGFVESVNKIPSNSQIFRVSTFDYRDTLKLLHKLYKQYSMQYHLNISPLGSKMQSIGIALFHYMKPEVSIIFAPPMRYNANNYSEMCKDTWIINFGSLGKIRNVLDEVGMVKIKTKQLPK